MLITTTNTLSALNEAIATAWPSIKVHAVETAEFTISRSTYSYVLSGITDMGPNGPVRLIAKYASDPVPMELRRWRASNSGGTWTILLNKHAAAKFDGYTVDVHYLKKVAPVTALSDDIDLPRDYLVSYVCYMYCLRAQSQQHADVREYRDLTLLHEKRWQEALQRNRTQSLV